MGALHLAALGKSTGAGSSKACQVLDAALGARGFAAGDFELEEQSSAELSQLLGVVGGILTVRCRSTGEERFYSTGSGSAWFGAFLMDLGRGHFATAARRADEVLEPASQGMGARALHS